MTPIAATHVREAAQTQEEARDLEVVVVTLTYARRWHLLGKVLDELVQHHPSIADIVVVSNNSSEPLEALVPRAQTRPRIHVLTLTDNLGSAEGYARGIQYATECSRAPLIWLLDDDNRPQSGGLHKLLAAYAVVGATPQHAVAALRRGSREATLAAHGLMNIRIRSNSFLGFHLLDLYAKARRRRLERKLPRPLEASFSHPITQVGYAPYGGLLFHRQWVTAIGLPNAHYFLYADDYEYTTRIATHGGKIYLCAHSMVEDLEPSWHKHKPRVHHLFEPGAKLGRLYYSTRNTAHLEASRFVTSWPTYLLNVGIYLGALCMQSLMVQRDPAHTFKRFKLILSALRAGWRGELGRTLPQRINMQIRSGEL